MSILLDRRQDGSLACFIDGDLQFDSRDEHIYHEGLALPALAVAEARIATRGLNALVIGGGDGLTARELLKSDRIAKLDLVDYDSKMISLARGEFSKFNNDSLADSRVNVSVEDARLFVKRAIEAGVTYDVIISDLTSPNNADAAQLHHVEFYETLCSLLGSDGVLAVNAASPSATPDAYWSIFNSMLLGKLNPRAYRIALPSFEKQNFGADWGFILGSARSIDASELEETVQLPKDCQFLTDHSVLRGLFFFPRAVVDRQQTAAAGSAKSDVLVHYLLNAISVESNLDSGIKSEDLVDTLTFNIGVAQAPVLETESYLLPIDVRHVLGDWAHQPEAEEALIERVFELMPALHRFQTREMVGDFLKRPAAFLSSINLGELVNELLKRALELPSKLREELVFLREKLDEYAQDHEGLLHLGLRSMAVIALVVVMGNLIYPDSVYAKGGHAGVYGGGTYGWGGTGVYTNPYQRKVINNKVINEKVIKTPSKAPIIENFNTKPGKSN